MNILNIYCKLDIFKYFEEYLNCFSNNGIEIINWKNKIENISTEDYNIFIQSIPINYMNYANCVINTEQFSNIERLKIFDEYIIKNISIIDYSQENIDILKKNIQIIIMYIIYHIYTYHQK